MTDFNALVDESAPDNSFQGWQKREPQSYKDVVLKQIELCRIEGSKQLVGNAELFQKTEMGLQRVSFFDQKKIYIQSVLTLHDLMLRYFDDNIKGKLIEIQKEIILKKKELLFYFIKQEPRADFKESARKTGEMINSPLGSRLINAFDSFVYSQHRKMFQELLLLYDRKNELAGKRSASVY